MHKNSKNRIMAMALQTDNLVKASVFFLAVTIFLYVYLVNAATFNTARAQKLTEEISVLQSEISDLELSYIDKTKSITIADAEKYSLVPNDKELKKVLVYKSGASKLTLRQQ